MHSSWTIDETVGHLPGVRIGMRSRAHEASQPMDLTLPIFIGFGALREPATTGHGMPWGLIECRRYAHFERAILPQPASYLRAAVRAFFANGGKRCLAQVVAVDPGREARIKALRELLQPGGMLDDRSDVDLVCIPDAVNPSPALTLGETGRQSVQEDQLAHCERRGDRFAILDAPLPAALPQLPESLRSGHGAMYFPWVVPDQTWVDVRRRSDSLSQWRRTDTTRVAMVSSGRPVPPCGHLAGVYARADQQSGIHRAPANLPLNDALDLSWRGSPDDHAHLVDQRVNLLVSSPSRGIRVTGARTLSHHQRWPYVSTARIVIRFRRWLEDGLRDLAFEPNTPLLHERIQLRLSEQCRAMWQSGELVGATAAQAYSVRCDEALNPASSRDLGQIIGEIKLAPSVPAEFIEVRVVLDATGFTISRP